MERSIAVLILSAFACMLGCGASPTTAVTTTPVVATILNQGGETQGTIQVTGKKGQVLTYGINAAARQHYTVCVAPVHGDADLYGSHAGTLKSSKNRGEWEGQGLPMRDCLTFEVFQKGVIQIKVVAIQDFEGELYFLGHPYDNVPPRFRNALVSPLDTLELTFPEFGPFGSPWGNRLRKYNPFADRDHDGFLHSGTDLAARRCTPIKATCTGTIVRSGMLDDEVPSEWGGYLIQECMRGQTTLAIAYDHLFPNPNRDTFEITSSRQETLERVCHVPHIRLAVGDEVKQGQTIGYIYKMLVEGEPDHLHFTICRGTYPECAEVKQQPQRGSIHYTLFPGKWIESDPRKNINLFK